MIMTVLLETAANRVICLTKKTKYSLRKTVMSLSYFVQDFTKYHLKCILERCFALVWY